MKSKKEKKGLKGEKQRMIDLRNGDCLEVLRALADNSIDAVVTDPPYGLSFMGKKWDYDVPSVEIWRECLRVLKPGGHLLSFAGTRTQHRMACNIEDAGFEIRDMIAWVYGSGFPKSLNIGKAVDKLQGNERKVLGRDSSAYRENAIKNNTNFTHNAGFKPEGSGLITKGTSEFEGFGTSLKPALEPITLARKPIEKGLSIAENCLKWGVGGLDIDGCRVGTEEILERVQGNNKNTSTPNAPNNGWISEPQTLGRFPANLIHDGSQEVLELFPMTKSVQSQRGKVEIFKKENSWIGESTVRGHNDSGSAARFFYCAKASKSERNRGCEGLEEQETVVFSNGKAGRCPIHNKTNPSGLNTYSCGCPIQYTKQRKEVKKNTNTHPTVKPIALMEYLVKLVSREGQTVLDPFAGSGTTGIACKNLNRNAILIEREAEYVEIAKCRMAV